MIQMRTDYVIMGPKRLWKHKEGNWSVVVWKAIWATGLLQMCSGALERLSKYISRPFLRELCSLYIYSLQVRITQGKVPIKSMGMASWWWETKTEVQFSFQVQSPVRTHSFAPWNRAHQGPSLVHHQTQAHWLTSLTGRWWPSSWVFTLAVILLLLWPPILPECILSRKSQLLRMRWPKYLEFQLQHHSIKKSGLISGQRMDWLAPWA